MSGPFGSTAWMANPASGFYGHTVDNSVRFETGSNGHLTHTLGTAGNLKLNTTSFWVKRSIIGANQYIFASGASLNTNYSNSTVFYFDETDQFGIYGETGGSQAIYIRTTQLLRDTSAWYHIVVAVDTAQSTATNRIKVYINGVQVTSFTNTNTGSQDLDTHIMAAATRRWGRGQTDGYINANFAQICQISGAALTPSSFGEFKNDIWIPKNLTGLTYAAGSYLLELKNSGVGTASSSTVGADTSGNDLHFTSSGLAVHDQVPDSPTNNFATYNSAMRANMTFSEGNLKALGVGGNYDNIAGTIAFDPTDSRGYYWEWYVVAHDDDTEIGIAKSDNVNFDQSDATNPTAHSSDTPSYRGNGQKKVANSNSSYGTAWDNGNILSVAVKSGSVFFYHNGTLQASGTAATTSLTGTWIPSFSINGTQSGIVNFGQDSSFAGNVTAQGNADANGKGDFYYAPPTGYVALCTANLPDPVETIDPAQGGSPQDYFNTVLYSGNSSTQAITGVGFQPDFTWSKTRNATDHNVLVDSVRGDKALRSNATTVEYDTGVSWQFDTDGFTMTGTSGELNYSGRTFATWNWKAGTAFSNDASATSVGSIDSTGSVNTDVGFSIISWTAVGSSATQTIAHGLGAVPKMIIMKNRERAVDWAVYHESIGNTHGLYLNLEDAAADDSGWWNDTTPTSTVFTTGNGNGYRTGGVAEDYIAYCFAEVDGYSKIGSYVGNGNADGTFIYTGFRPAMVIFKTSGVSRGWNLMDTKREGDAGNPLTQVLGPNFNDGEYTHVNYSTDFLSNGFKMRNTTDSWNGNGEAHIYIAFAEQPFKYANAR